MTSVEKIEQHLEGVEKELNDFLGDDQLSPLNLVEAVIHLMQAVALLPKLKGEDKKALVLAILQKYIDKYHPENIVLELVPVLIDALIGVEKGELVINGPEKCLAKCFSFCKK